MRDDRINGCRRQALVVYLDITAVLLPSICTSALSSTILNVVRGSEEGVTHFYRLSLASTLLHSLTVPCVSVASVVCETITYLPDRLLSSSSSASSGCDTDIRRSNLIARTRTNELQFCSLIASNVLHALEIQSLAPGEVPAQLWVQFLANRNLLKENKNGSGDAVSIELEEQMEDVLAFRSESAEMVIAMFRGECSVGGWVGGHQILTMGIDQLIKYLDTIRLISASYDPVPIAPISNTTNNITTLMEAYALTEISLHLFSHFVDEVNVLWFMLGDEEEKNEELGRNEISYGRVTEIQCSVLMQLLGSIRLIAEFMDSRHHYFFQFSSSPTIHIDNNIHSVTTVERGSSFQSLAFYYLEMWQYAPAILSAAWSLQSQEILLVNTCDLLELSLAAIKFMCQCLGVASLRKPAARSLLALITRLQSHLVSQAESICMWLSQALLQADTQQILRDEPLLAEKLHACHSRMACIVSDPESQYQIFITSFTALIQGLGQAVHTLSEVFNKQLLSLQSTQQQLSASVPSGHIFQLLSEVLYLQRSLIGFLEGFCQATISSEIDSKLKTLVSVAVGTLLQITEHTSILLACLSYSVNSFSSGSFSRADEQLMSLYVSVVDNCSFAMSRLISIHLSTEFALHGSHQLQSIVYNSHTLVSAYPSKSQSSLRHLSAICRSLLQISELFCTTSTTTSTGTSTSTLSFGSSTVDYSIGSIQISAFASMAALLSYATTLLRLQSVLQSSLSSPTALNGAVNESAMLLLQKCVKTVRDILNENPSLVNIQLPYGFLLNQPDDPFCQFIIPAIANIYAQVLSNNCSVGDGMTLRRLPYDSILVSYLMLCCQHLSAGSITLSSVSSIVAVSVSRQFASLWVRLVGTNATDNNNKSEIAWFQQEFIYLYLFQLCCRSDLPASSRLVECFVALLEWSYTSVDVLTCNQCVEQAASKARSQIILFPSDDKIAKYNARLNDVLTTIENYVLLHRDSSIIKSDLVKICC